MNDRVSELLTRIRNGVSRRHEVVSVPYSGMNEHIVHILTEEGYLLRHETVTENRFPVLRIYLRFTPAGRAVIENISQVSSPGKRLYVKKDAVPRVQNGLGIAILSTPHGLMTDRKAREHGVGGEVVCYVW